VGIPSEYLHPHVITVANKVEILKSWGIMIIHHAAQKSGGF